MALLALQPASPQAQRQTDAVANAEVLLYYQAGFTLLCLSSSVPLVQAVTMNHVATRVYPAFVDSLCFTMYAQMQAFAFRRPPLTKASFRWIKPLGRGGYGMVYAAQKLDTGKLYAVKCMGACQQLCAVALTAAEAPSLSTRLSGQSRCTQTSHLGPLLPCPLSTLL